MTDCEAAVCCGLGMGIDLAGQRYSSYNCPVLLFPYLISTLYSFPKASGSLTRITTLHLFLRSQRTEPYTIIP